MLLPRVIFYKYTLMKFICKQELCHIRVRIIDIPRAGISNKLKVVITLLYEDTHIFRCFNLDYFYKVKYLNCWLASFLCMPGRNLL